MSDALLEPVSEAIEAHIPNRGKQHLTQEQIAKVLRLNDDGLTQPQIADALGVHHTTIGRCLAKFYDTSDLALRQLKANAQKAATRTMDIMEKGKPDVALKAAKVVLAASGVTERVSGITVGVQVIIGDQTKPAIGADSITVQAVKE